MSCGLSRPRWSMGRSAPRLLARLDKARDGVTMLESSGFSKAHQDHPVPVGGSGCGPLVSGPHVLLVPVLRSCLLQRVPLMLGPLFVLRFELWLKLVLLWLRMAGQYPGRYVAEATYRAWGVEPCSWEPRVPGVA